MTIRLSSQVSDIELLLYAFQRYTLLPEIYGWCVEQFPDDQRHADQMFLSFINRFANMKVDVPPRRDIRRMIRNMNVYIMMTTVGNTKAVRDELLRRHLISPDRLRAILQSVRSGCREISKLAMSTSIISPEALLPQVNDPPSIDDLLKSAGIDSESPDQKSLAESVPDDGNPPKWDGNDGESEEVDHDV